MAGQSGSLSVNFSSSGAGGVAADAAAVKSAIDSIPTSKTCTINVVVRNSGAAGREARDFASGMRNAREHAAGFERDVGRATRATSGMGREAQKTGSHVRNLHDNVRALAAGAEILGQRMALSAGAAETRRQLTGASQAMKELESGAGRAAIAAREIKPSTGGAGGGSVRDSIIDMQQLEDGTWGVARGMRAIEAGAAGAGRAASGSGFQYAEGVTPRPEGTYSKAHAKEQERAASGMAANTRQWRTAANNIDEVGNASARAGGKAGGLGSTLGKLSNAVWPVAAGTAMFAGAMESATSHSTDLLKSTAGLGMSYDNMGKMLTRTMQQTARGQGLGLSSMDADLKQHARAMTNQLGPAIKGSVDATHALTNAGMDAWGNLSSNIAGFASTAQSRAPQIQGIMQSLGAAALSMGSATVDGVANSQGAIGALGAAVQNNQSTLSGMVTGGVNVMTGVGAASANVAGNARDTTSNVADAVMPKGSRKSIEAGGLRFGADTPFGIGVSPRALGTLAQSGPVGAALAAGAVQAGMVDRGGGGGAPADGGTTTSTVGGSAAHQKAVAARDSVSAGDLQRRLMGGGGGGGAAGGRLPMQFGGGGIIGAGPGAGVIARSSSALQQLRTSFGQTGQAAQSAAGVTGAAAGQIGLRTQQGAQQATQSVRAMPAAMTSAAPAAAVGGAHVGSSMAGGVASGASRTMTVTDNVMRRHVQRITDSASGAAQQGGQAVGAAMGMGTGAGVSSTQTVTDQVVRKHVKKLVDIMADALGIKSPSRVTAARIGSPMAQGVGVGFAGGAPTAAATMVGAGAQMSAALQGPMSDYGLQVGYTYAQAFADGSSRVLKKASTQALGLPDDLSPDAMSRLANTGLLRAGSGASTWKSNSGGVGTVTLGGAPASITVVVPGQDVKIGDEVIASIADRQIELAFNQATGTYQTL